MAWPFMLALETLAEPLDAELYSGTPVKDTHESGHLTKSLLPIDI